MSNNNNASDRTDEVICDCSGTTRGKIISLVEQGIVDTDTISRKLAQFQAVVPVNMILRTCLMN